jgi:hypothetical protein
MLTILGRDKDLAQHKATSGVLTSTDLCAPFLDKPPRLIGAGSYNDVFAVTFKGKQLVMRLSYYSPYTLGKVQALIRQQLPYKQLMSRAQRITASDPVTVKNNYSRLTNILIEHNVCPHFVHMFHAKDVKCFAAMLRDQVKPERMRNNMSFRYNNVSFHEKFQTSLRLKLRHLSDMQQVVAVFQVFHAMAMLQQYVPNFRHNDLSLDNILITMTLPPARPKYIHYHLAGTDYWLPDTGIFTAVTDFDLAHAPASVQGPTGKPYSLQNQLITKDQFGNHNDAEARKINASPNRSFDAWYFLFRLRGALCNNNNSGGQQQQQLCKWLQTHELLSRFPDTKYASEVYPTLYPAVLLANAPIFQQFRLRPPPGSEIVGPTIQPRKLPIDIMLKQQPPQQAQNGIVRAPPVVGRPAIKQVSQVGGRKARSSGRKVSINAVLSHSAKRMG